MSLPEIRVTKDEMRARVAYFKDLKGFDAFCILRCDPDGTRTRDLRRDRAAF